MKVLFDHQTFTLQEFGGISRYFFELYKQFHNGTAVEPMSSLTFSNNEYLQSENIIKHKPFFRNRTFKGKLRIMLFLNTWRSVQTFKKQQFDIFHPTYYDPYYLKFNSTKPLVITCLDLIHEKFIQNDLQTISNKKTVFQRADKIFAISESTKTDLIEHYNIEPSKIVVTYLATSFTRQESASAPHRFFLYVGARNLYKNFLSFIEAMAPVLHKHRDVYLYCAGGPPFNEIELATFARLKIADKVQRHSGLDSSLQRLYSSAIALLYPSKYEGFGIPLIEAMNCGCPVGASNVSSLPEVGANAALYFNPDKQEEITQVAETLLEDSSKREEIIRLGYLRAKQFTWANTAAVTQKTYQSLL